MRLRTNAHEGELIEVAPGIWLPPAVDVVAENLHGFDVTLVVVPSGGRLAVRDLCVKQRDGGPAVTSEVIRAIPVASIAKQAMQNAQSRKQGFAPIAISRGQMERLREQGPTSETLEWVARIYRFALVTGDSPTKAVEDAFDIPRSTTGRWVSMARERQLLGPADGPGKAGA